MRCPPSEPLAARLGTCRGSVTAELAVGLPSVVIALAVVVCVAQVVTASVQCADAARAGARYAARGEPDPRVVRVAVALAPPGSRVGVARQGGLVRVRVDARVPLALPGSPALEVGAEAVADAESVGAG